MATLVTGATGFIGHALLKSLDGPIHVLSRNGPQARQTLAEAGFDVRAWSWNATAEPPPAAALEGVRTVFHLAGESVASRRWNEAQRRAIRDSRVLGTRHLVDAIGQLDGKPEVLVCASAVGYYGIHPAVAELDESSPPGDDFLAQVCVEWEREAARAAQFGVRAASVRIGVVLGREGGALAQMLTPFRLGLGGVLAGGRQWMPWVALADVIGVMRHAAASEEVAGPINATSPNPVTNREFTKTLGRVLRRPTMFPMPGFMLRLLMGDFAEVVLASQRVLPRVAERTGYRFVYPQLEAALRAELG